MSAEAAVIPAVAPICQSRRFGINLIANVGNLGLTMVVGVLYVFGYNQPPGIREMMKLTGDETEVAGDE